MSAIDKPTPSDDPLTRWAAELAERDREAPELFAMVKTAVSTELTSGEEDLTGHLAIGSHYSLC